MSREKFLESIFAQFDKSANDFCNETNGLLCEISSDYKGEEKAANLRSMVAEIYYNTYVLMFRYTAHGALGTLHHIVDCCIRFDKTEEALPIPLPFVTDFCDENIVTPLCIPFISNAAGMAQAIGCIGNAVKQLTEKITAISLDDDRKQAMCNYFLQEYKTVLKEKTDDFVVTPFFYHFITMRFASQAYILAIKGKTEKAVKALEKCKEKFRYEERMLRLWKSGTPTDASEIPAVAVNMEWIKDSGVQRESIKELLPIFLSWFVLAIPIGAVLVGLYFLLTAVQKVDTVYLTGVRYNWPYCMIAAFVTAIAVSYFTRFRFAKLFIKKDYEQLKEKDYVFNGGGADRFMKGFLAVVAVGAVAVTFFTATWNLNFKKNGFIDNRKFLSITGPYYSYEKIDHVEYVPNRKNGLGDTLKFPSYALVMKNGEKIDLYEYDEIESYEPVLINYLQKQGIKIEK
ncbi:MAG: hypothetical protein MJ132_04885 [Clostridia bacterium]|nr:hypothetical protein [Clostridia bacterium]